MADTARTDEHGGYGSRPSPSDVEGGVRHRYSIVIRELSGGAIRTRPPPRRHPARLDIIGPMRLTRSSTSANLWRGWRCGLNGGGRASATTGCGGGACRKGISRLLLAHFFLPALLAQHLADVGGLHRLRAGGQFGAVPVERDPQAVPGARLLLRRQRRLRLACRYDISTENRRTGGRGGTPGCRSGASRRGWC